MEEGCGRAVFGEVSTKEDQEIRENCILFWQGEDRASDD